MNASGSMTQIGKYRILSELGRGGMGVVYRAEDRFIGREVAIKTLTDTTPQTRERFNIEARSGVLNHPNIVTVYDFGEHEGNPYIVMEFLHGLTLERIVKDQREMPLVEKLDVMRQVCEGLGYAHSRGVVHRDVKPANIVVQGNGGVKLVDFGIAQLEALSGHTVAGSVIGTYQYLAPERLKGEVSDGRADIWSAGVVLYLLLTGTLPFPGDDISTLHHVITDPYAPLATLLSTSYPESLDNIISRALAKNPADRYPSAMEMAGDLESTRDAIRLMRMEDLLGQVRSLIDENELLRARPLLLDLQRLSPQNTAVRNLMRELQDRLARRAEAPSSEPAITEPSSSEPATTNAEPGVEDRSREAIIAQIVAQIRTQAEHGQLPRALELVKRSLERAPGSAPLLDLQEQILAMLAEQQSAERAPIVAESAAPEVFATGPVAEGQQSPTQTELAPFEAAVAPPTSAAIETETEAVIKKHSEPGQVGQEPSLAEAHSRITEAAPSSTARPPMGEPPVERKLVADASSALLPPTPTEEHSNGLKTAAVETRAASDGTPVSADHAHAPAPVSLRDEPRVDPTATERGLGSSRTPEVAAAAVLPVEAAAPTELPSSTSAAPETSPSNVAEKVVKRSDSATVLPLPAKRSTSPTVWIASAVVLVSLLVALGLFVSHRRSPASSATPMAAAPVTFGEVIASPAGRVLRVQAEDGSVVHLPAEGADTPMHLTGLKAGNYLIVVAAPNSPPVETHCALDATHHTCFTQLTPLSDADVNSILKGGAQ